MIPHLADTPVLETARLTLRAPRFEDYPAWEAFYRSPRAEFIGGSGNVRDAWRAFAHVTGMWALRGFAMFVFARRDTGAPIGFAGPWQPIDWPEPELGWNVWSAADEGQGYVFEAASAARDYAYGVLGWTTAVSYIDPGNARSIALAERLGCTRDPDAALPEFGGAAHVYRHPAPEGRA